MARPQKISDQEILAAARHCFLTHGPSASCELIASDLDISAAAIFKRFGTKEQLLIAALPLALPEWVGKLGAGPNPDEPMRPQLVVLASRLLMFFREMIPVLTLLKASGLGPSHFPSDGSAPPVVLQRATAAYFESAVSGGLVALADPLAAAQALIGGAMARAMLEHLNGVPQRGDEVFLHGLVQVLWAGMCPRMDPSGVGTADPLATPLTYSADSHRRSAKAQAHDAGFVPSDEEIP